MQAIAQPQPSTTRPARSLPSHAFERLSATLAWANTRQRAKASVFADTCGDKRTFHAQKRAARLGLAVDVIRAVNCPHNRVSHVPLPVIEVASPMPVPVAREDQRRSSASRLDVPRDVAGYNTIDLRAPFVLHGQPVAASNAFCGVLPWNAYSYQSAYIQHLQPQQPQHAPVVPILLYDDEQTRVLELGYPTDSDGEDEVEEPMMSASDSSSSSSSATSGPSTPSDIEMSSASGTGSAPGKRKHDGEIGVAFEKRAKYARKPRTFSRTYSADSALSSDSGPQGSSAHRRIFSNLKTQKKNIRTLTSMPVRSIRIPYFSRSLSSIPSPLRPLMPFRSRARPALDDLALLYSIAPPTILVNHIPFHVNVVVYRALAFLSFPRHPQILYLLTCVCFTLSLSCMLSFPCTYSIFPRPVQYSTFVSISESYIIPGLTSSC
uniref:Uncharacterized protein n=1 Tax=Mycena chlorophos TaxID=658473 RepID=A0ABQ0LIA5_MYCCL|nr:predicted protein [Mycena chlorophos]